MAWQEYWFEVTISLPNEEARTVELSLEDDSYKDAIEDALNTVIHEEGLTEEDRQYLSIEKK